LKWDFTINKDETFWLRLLGKITSTLMTLGLEIRSRIYAAGNKGG
jgi:hypothetical protein